MFFVDSLSHHSSKYPLPKKWACCEYLLQACSRHKQNLKFYSMRERHCCEHAANILPCKWGLRQACSKHSHAHIRTASCERCCEHCCILAAIIPANKMLTLLQACGKHFTMQMKFAASLQQTFTSYIEIAFISHCCIQFFKDRFASLLALINNFKWKLSVLTMYIKIFLIQI